MSEEDVILDEEKREAIPLSKETKSLIEAVAERLGITPEDVISRAINALIDREAPRIMESTQSSAKDPLDKALEAQVNRLLGGEDVNLNDLLKFYMVKALMQSAQPPAPQYTTPQPQDSRDRLVELAGIAMIASAFNKPQSDPTQIVSLLGKLMEAKSTEEIKQIIREYQQNVQQEINSVRAELYQRTEKPSLEDEIISTVKEEIGEKIRELIKKGVIKEEDVVTPEGKINWNKIVDQVMKLLNTWVKASERRPPPTTPPIPIEEVKPSGATPGRSQAPSGPISHEEEASQATPSPATSEAPAPTPEASPGEAEGDSSSPEQAGSSSMESTERVSETSGEGGSEKELESTPTNTEGSKPANQPNTGGKTRHRTRRKKS